MRIRPFRPDDAPGVAALWEYWFRSKTRTPGPGLVRHVQRLFVEHPVQDDEVTPLVAEDENGAMLGFLGVTVTKVRVDGRDERLAGVFPSVVDPDVASTTVATFLLRRFLQGPQAFTLSDGGHVRFERIWEKLGGRIDPLGSLRWVKVFRPARLGAGMLGGEGLRGVMGTALSPVATGVDWLARKGVPARLTSRAADLDDAPLTPAGLADAMAELRGDARLRPEYSDDYASWLLGEMGRIRGQGTLTARRLHTKKGELAGWYVYYLKEGGVSRVFALDAREPLLDGVVDHLFAHADEGGAAAVVGRLQPRLRRPMTARGCLVHAGGSLLMVHAKDPSLMDDALLGRLAFSRLEGENWYWWGIVGDTAEPGS